MAEVGLAALGNVRDTRPRRHAGGGWVTACQGCGRGVTFQISASGILGFHEMTVTLASVLTHTHPHVLALGSPDRRGS